MVGLVDGCNVVGRAVGGEDRKMVGRAVGDEDRIVGPVVGRVVGQIIEVDDL